jgi:hypothetical protein
MVWAFAAYEVEASVEVVYAWWLGCVDRTRQGIEHDDVVFEAELDLGPRGRWHVGPDVELVVDPDQISRVS